MEALSSFQPNFWHWWIVASLLMITEVLTPGTFFFLWSGVAAIVVGLLLLIIPGISFEVQVFFFAVVSIVCLVVGRTYLKRYPIESEEPLLNQRGAQYVGRTFTVTREIVHGAGEIRVGDGFWTAEGPDCPEGTTVKVVGVHGTRLQVELLPPTKPPLTK